MRTTRPLALAASTLMSAFGLYGQSVISAHSGTLHFYEGDVTIDGQAPHQKAGTFSEVKEKQELDTQVGRAEVLLTPGAFLRMGENSGIRMVSNKLVDTRIGFVKGSAILDLVEVVKDNSVKMNYQDYDVTFLKKGIYRFDSEPAEFKVYTGEAVVTHAGTSVTLKDGRALPFTPALVSEKFDNHTGDALYRWAKRRSENLAVANLSAARKAGSSYAPNGTPGSWTFNPYYSMYTFLPANGILCDPFAFYACYYSGNSAWRYYYQPTYNNKYYGGGGGGNSRGSYNSAGYYPTSMGTSSTLSSYSSAPSYSGPSVGASSAVSSSSGGFSSAGASSTGGGGFSGGGGGGGGASHGGGSAGGHGK
jgi:hypothetical protein